MVEGEEARESGSTCCGSFVEKKTSTAKIQSASPKKILKSDVMPVIVCIMKIADAWQTKLVSPVRMPVSVRKQNV